MATTGRRNVVWKTPTVTADGLKLFATVMMLIANTGIAVIQNGIIHLERYTQAELSETLAEDAGLMLVSGIGLVMQMLGGLAVTIFAFLLVEGFLHTSNYRKYLLTMLGFALVSEIPYDLAINQKILEFSGQNVLFTLVICLLMLYFLGMVKEGSGFTAVFVRIMIVLCAVAWVSLFRTAYGLCMVLLTAIFYLLYHRNVLKTILGIVVSLLHITGPLAFYGIWFYNEKRKDRIPKYAYYAFYPLHLLVLALAAMLL